MASSVHITVMREMLKSGKPVKISLWTKSGEIQTWTDCVSLKYDFYKGVRNMKLLNSRQIRKVRDVCIFRINDMDVYL